MIQASIADLARYGVAKQTTLHATLVAIFDVSSL